MIEWLVILINKGSSEVCSDPNASMGIRLENKFRFRSWEKPPTQEIWSRNSSAERLAPFFVTSSGSLRSARRKLASMILFGNELRRRTLFCLLSSYFFFRAIHSSSSCAACLLAIRGCSKESSAGGIGWNVCSAVSFSSVIVFAFVDELPRLNWVISCFTLEKHIPDFFFFL